MRQRAPRVSAVIYRYNPPMHPHETPTSSTLVHKLLQDQFPHWSHLPITPVASAGTDNAIYRLGTQLAVRLPRIPSAVPQIHKEQRWLPHLAPHLPLSIPQPLATGAPAHGYPFPWSVCRWLRGQNAHDAPPADLQHTALALARFIRSLQSIDPGDGPSPGDHNFGRGVPLAARDAATRKAIAQLHGMIDTAAATIAWEAALRAAPYAAAPLWLHGDLIPTNLLTRNGRLSAVIDFGALALGDPACDLQPAWNLLTPAARSIFRAHLKADEDTWQRGQGWSLSVALIALPYYRHTNPTLAAISRHTLDAILGDQPGTGIHP